MGEYSMQAPSARCYFRAFGLHILSCRKRRSSGLSRSVKPLQGAVPSLRKLSSRPSSRKGTSHAISSGCGSSMPSVGKRQQQAWKACWGNTCELIHQPGGMHLILRLQGRRSDRRLVARMREEGLYGEALTDWTMGNDGASALLLNFTNIDSQRTAEKLGRRILRLI